MGGLPADRNCLAVHPHARGECVVTVSFWVPTTPSIHNSENARAARCGFVRYAASCPSHVAASATSTRPCWAGWRRSPTICTARAGAMRSAMRCR